MACPAEAPIFCGHETVSRGLCVKEAVDCNSRASEPRAVPKTPENEKGKKYSYVETHLGRHCYFTKETLKVDYDMSFTDGEAVPASFSCLTYNIWGLARKDEQAHLFTLRQPLLEKTIRESGADLLCLQEMSEFSYGRLTTLISEYKFASEIPYPATHQSDRNRAVDTYFLSKYKPSRVTLYNLPGVLGYSNCLLVIEYSNLVVFNLYNQAGSRSSPGQGLKWIHYSRCRYDILETIYDMIKDSYSGKNSIICGDFNFHLDGELKDWPELAMIDRFKADGFIDTFRQVNPDDPGFTEDTDFNAMRWNQKLIEKQYRYDGILFKGAWKPTGSVLIGRETECLTPEDSEWFIKNMSEVKESNLDDLWYCKDKTIPINASDHFGVLTTFTQGGGRRRFRKTRRKQTQQKQKQKQKRRRTTKRKI